MTFANTNETTDTHEPVTANTTPATPLIPADSSLHSLHSLHDILSMRRGHGSDGEAELVTRYILPLDPIIWAGESTPRYHSNYATTPANTTHDNHITAAYTVRVDDTPILWSCHIDTVHPTTDPVRQDVAFEPEVGLMWKEDKSPLGADDGVAVWLFLEMIKAKVPGTYIFHRGEEKGGIGSRIMANTHKEFIGKFTHAVAIDRRKTCSVITHQGSGRCCSDKFAEHVAEMLSDKAYTLKPDDTGVYTDTAEYVGLIGECTNISAGYQNEHTGGEILDVEYAQWLRDKLLSLDVSAFISVSDRKPGDVEYKNYGGYGGWGDYSSWEDYDTWRYGKSGTKSSTTEPIRPALSLVEPPEIADLDERTTAEDLIEYKESQIEDWVKMEQPWVVAALIHKLAYQVIDMEDELRDMYATMEEAALALAPYLPKTKRKGHK